jgi:hypothetical protein
MSKTKTYDSGYVIARLMKMSNAELIREATKLLAIKLSEMKGDFVKGVTMKEYRFMVMSELEFRTPVTPENTTWNSIKEKVLDKHIEYLNIA